MFAICNGNTIKILQLRAAAVDIEVIRNDINICRTLDIVVVIEYILEGRNTNCVKSKSFNKDKFFLNYSSMIILENENNKNQLKIVNLKIAIIIKGWKNL